MATYLGIDLGTTALKLIVSDGRSKVIAAATVPVKLTRPHPGWSEQNPEEWCRALRSACRKLSPQLPGVGGISFSGQMHGLVLLDSRGKPLRPAILWNDSRASTEAKTLNTSHPELAAIAGVRAMASFFAPKLLWLQKTEPALWRQVRAIMAPKDYLRFRMTGEYATDPVDASGMWLCDAAKRTWSVPILKAARMPQDVLVPIREAGELAGNLTRTAATALGLRPGIPVITGTGDAAASALGLGLADEGDAVISMGTSAQIIMTKNQHVPNPAQNIHAFCHGLPNRWFQMAALLNGASPLAWLAEALSGSATANTVEALLRPIEKTMMNPSTAMFLPYLNGERTPHDNPAAKAAFVGLDHTVGRTELTRAVLEGVAFSLADCYDIMKMSGSVPKRVLIVGGGTRSPLWTRIIASALNRELLVAEAGEYGASLGAARLARLGTTGETVKDIFKFPAKIERVQPVPRWAEAYGRRLEDFRALYHALKGVQNQP